MNIKQTTIEWITKKLKIPASAMQMFRAANEISGIDKNLLPTELVPLNAIQLSRGLLNFTFIQSRLNWILPFWAEQQYNPTNIAFVPRSHLGLSMNITHRNWTAVGNPQCKTEPIVDPAGMITPFKNGWSVDIWAVADEEIYFPSKRKVSQRLIEDLPVTETSFNINGIDVITTVFTSGTNLVINTAAKNNNITTVSAKIIFAVRPFNPEGISLINSIKYEKNKKRILINDENEILPDTVPDIFLSSNFENGDCSLGILKAEESKDESVCKYGMANAAAVYKNNLFPGEEVEYRIKIKLAGETIEPVASINEHLASWNSILSQGVQIKTPDSKLNSIMKNSAASLLMLCDDEEIMPGPFTYHQFWFRDAAYMLYALDKLGFHNYSRPVINSFRKHLAKDGYFRSQKGEWDSNGQAIWTIYQHYTLTGDKMFLNENFNSCFRGIMWIKNNRLPRTEHSTKNYFGLLPQGLSAEHLGLVDHYYWDNFWSLAGIRAFISICEVLSKDTELEYAQNLYSEYHLTIFSSIKRIQSENNIDYIPAGPSRNNDCGMIGSVCAFYPLQLLFEKEEVLSTLNFVSKNYFHKGLFFQNFIHSGMNIYLTLQVAHSYLFQQERSMFLKILNNVIEAASPVYNYPEAIHPHTGGGCMGDGHHGWAAAEFVLAIRDAFVYERYNEENTDLIIFSGIPAHWFDTGKSFSIKDAPIQSGSISIWASSDDELIKIIISYNPRSNNRHRWKLLLPVICASVQKDENTLQIRYTGAETEIILQPGSTELLLKRGNTQDNEMVNGEINKEKQSPA